MKAGRINKESAKGVTQPLRMEVSKEARPGLPIHLAGCKEDTDKGEVGKRPNSRTNSLVGN